jgi:hypothetical protein
MSRDDPTPLVSPEAREAARHSPGGWVYEIDPFFDADGDVPPYGIVGAWPVDDRGEISEEFERNPNYRPSPVALEFPEPVDPLDAAAQLAVTGYGENQQAAAALLRSQVFVASGDEDSLWVHEVDGKHAVFVFSSEQHLPREPLLGSDGWRRIDGGRLAELLPEGSDVVVNVGGPAPWAIGATDLRRIADAD